MSRTGKIARLPRDLRNILNTRLANGEPGPVLLAWLNSLPEVQATLDDHFDGRPVTSSNLSEWRKGGYQDWLSHCETMEWARLASDEAGELEQESLGIPLSDRLATRATVAVIRLIRKLESGNLEEPGQVRRLLQAVRVLTSHRACDQRAARLRMDLQRWKDEEAELERKARHRSLWGPYNELQQVHNFEKFIRKATAGMTPEQVRHYRSQLSQDMPPPPGPPDTAAPAESSAVNLPVSGFAKRPAVPSHAAPPGPPSLTLRLPDHFRHHPGKSG